MGDYFALVNNASFRNYLFSSGCCKTAKGHHQILSSLKRVYETFWEVQSKATRAYVYDCREFISPSGKSKAKPQELMYTIVESL
ncbi:hypothetical protein SDJN02_20441, partial [Cucurbita argyrosperma subsp. argyrosperma]